MSAAYFLARLGYPVTVFEAMPVPGGMMAIGIPEYRLPRTVLREEIERIVGLGVELRLTRPWAATSRSASSRKGYRAIFLATGASKSRRLGVPGDDLQGVVPATVFLKEVNLGERPSLTGSLIVVGGGARRWTPRDALVAAPERDRRSIGGAGRHAGPARGVAAAEREGIMV